MLDKVCKKSVTPSDTKDSIKPYVRLCIIWQVRDSICIAVASKIKIKELLNNSLRRVRGSRPKVFSKKVVLRNSAKFTGKHLC